MSIIERLNKYDLKFNGISIEQKFDEMDNSIYKKIQKNEIYNTCKQFSDIINGPLSKKTKVELCQIIS